MGFFTHKTRDRQFFWGKPVDNYVYDLLTLSQGKKFCMFAK